MSTPGEEVGTLTIGPRLRDGWAATAGALPAVLVVVAGVLLGAPGAVVAAVAVVVLLGGGWLAVARHRTVVGAGGAERHELLRTWAVPWDTATGATVGRWERPGGGGPGTGTGETWLYVTGSASDGSRVQVPLVSTASLARTVSSSTPHARRTRGLWRAAIAAVEHHGVTVRADPSLPRADLAALAELRG